METGERARLLEQVRDWFDDDSKADHYRTEAGAGPTQAEATLLTALPAPPRAVLDIGCGAGRIALSLAARGYQVTGVDVSEALVGTARGLAAKAGLSARFQTVDPLSLPFEPASFDAAVAVKVYCYIPSEASRKDYLAETARVLRPGAPLLLTSHVVPAPDDALDALEADPGHQAAAAAFSSLEPFDTFADARGYVHWFTANALLAELAGSSFVVERIRHDASGLQVMVELRSRRR